MEDRAGALYEVSKVIAQEGGNIVRVDYQKAVDLHTLFIDVEANRDELKRITKRLKDIGCLDDFEPERQVMLIELKLEDIPGKMCTILEIINKYDINISYINSQSKDMPYQQFRMGLYIENRYVVKSLLNELKEECEIEVLNYSVTKKVMDSTVFYIGFADEMRSLLSLNKMQTSQFVIESNRIMQFLESQNEPPFKTFKYIRRFAKFITNHKGNNFCPIIEKHQLTKKVNAVIIEPPCGSNTYILDDGNELLFIDGGFQCYLNETIKIIKDIFPDFDKRKKSIIITHADIDHVGLIPIFDDVYMSENCRINLEMDYEGEDNYREQNPFHAPYCRLSKIITSYVPSDPAQFKIIGQKTDDAVLSKIGTFSFADLNFMVFEGNGGHVKGESVFFDPQNKVIFTGDNFVNIKGFSDDQMAFNKLAPYLMTSVNMDSEEATRCRKVLMKWTEGCLVCPGHGMWLQR